MYPFRSWNTDNEKSPKQTGGLLKRHFARALGYALLVGTLILMWQTYRSIANINEPDPSKFKQGWLENQLKPYGLDAKVDRHLYTNLDYMCDIFVGRISSPSQSLTLEESSVSKGAMIIGELRGDAFTKVTGIPGYLRVASKDGGPELIVIVRYHVSDHWDFEPKWDEYLRQYQNGELNPKP